MGSSGEDRSAFSPFRVDFTVSAGYVTSPRSSHRVSPHSFRTEPLHVLGPGTGKVFPGHTGGRNSTACPISLAGFPTGASHVTTVRHGASDTGTPMTG